MKFASELVDLSTIHCKSCAIGRKFELETEIQAVRTKIAEIKAVFDENAKLKLFNGFSYQTAIKTATQMGDLEDCRLKYMNAISELTTQYGI